MNTRATSIKTRILVPWILLLVALPCGSCATTVGIVAGPVTGPVTSWRNTYAMPAWSKPLALPFGVVFGPILGLYQGIRCDLGWLRNGAYGVEGAPSFDAVFDPTSPEPRARLLGGDGS